MALPQHVPTTFKYLQHVHVVCEASAAASQVSGDHIVPCHVLGQPVPVLPLSDHMCVRWSHVAVTSFQVSHQFLMQQESPRIQQQSTSRVLQSAAALPVDEPRRLHLGGPEGQGLQGTWHQPHRRRKLLQQQQQQQPLQGGGAAGLKAGGQPVAASRSSQQQPLQHVGTGAAGRVLQTVPAATSSQQPQLRQPQPSLGAAGASGTSLKQQASAEQAEKQATVSEQIITPSPLYFVVFFATGTRVSLMAALQLAAAASAPCMWDLPSQDTLCAGNINVMVNKQQALDLFQQAMLRGCCKLWRCSFQRVFVCAPKAAAPEGNLQG